MNSSVIIEDVPCLTCTKPCKEHACPEYVVAANDLHDREVAALRAQVSSLENGVEFILRTLAEGVAKGGREPASMADALAVQAAEMCEQVADLEAKLAAFTAPVDSIEEEVDAACLRIQQDERTWDESIRGELRTKVEREAQLARRVTQLEAEVADYERSMCSANDEVRALRKANAALTAGATVAHEATVPEDMRLEARPLAVVKAWAEFRRWLTSMGAFTWVIRGKLEGVDEAIREDVAAWGRLSQLKVSAVNVALGRFAAAVGPVSAMPGTAAIDPVKLAEIRRHHELTIRRAGIVAESVPPVPGPCEPQGSRGEMLSRAWLAMNTLDAADVAKVLALAESLPGMPDIVGARASSPETDRPFPEQDDRTCGPLASVDPDWSKLAAEMRERRLANVPLNDAEVTDVEKRGRESTGRCETGWSVTDERLEVERKGAAK